MAQVKPLILLPNGNFKQIDTDKDDLTSKTLTSKSLIISNDLVGEKIRIQANYLDMNNRVFNLNNSIGHSVFSINGLGDTVTNNLDILGNQTITGSLTASSYVEIEGYLNIKNNVFLGKDQNSLISFIGKSSSTLDMNSNSIKNLNDPIDNLDAVNKKYLNEQTSNKANINLGNLSDVAINVDLLPDVANSHKIGNESKPFNSVFSENVNSYNFIIKDSSNNTSGILHSDLATVKLETSLSGLDSLDFSLSTIDTSGSGTAGDINLTAGINSSDLEKSGNININSKKINLEASQYISIKSDILPDGSINLGSSLKHFDNIYSNSFNIYNGSNLSGYLKGSPLNGLDITSLGNIGVSGSIISLKAVQYVDINNKNIKNLSDPVDLQDACTKKYVDDLLSNSVSDIKITFKATGDISAGSPVYVDPSFDESVSEASALYLGTSIIAGISENEILSGEQGLITIAGFANIPSSRILEGQFSRGDPIFLSEEFGKLTQTPPINSGSRVYQLGVAVSPNKMIISLKQGISVV